MSAMCLTDVIFSFLIDFLLNFGRQTNMWYSASALWWRATWDCHLPTTAPQQAPRLAHGESEKASVWINSKIINRRDGFSTFCKPYFSNQPLTVSKKKSLCAISTIFFRLRSQKRKLYTILEGVGCMHFKQRVTTTTNWTKVLFFCFWQ